MCVADARAHYPQPSADHVRGAPVPVAAKWLYVQIRTGHLLIDR